MDKVKTFYNDQVILQPEKGNTIPETRPSRWTSKDLDPTPGPQRRWEWYHVGGFWIAEGFSAAQVQTSSASVQLGLNPGLALGAYVIGNFLIAIPCCGNGYIGSKYSINFPVAVRAFV